MLRKLITFVLLLVTVNGFSLRSENNDVVTETDTIDYRLPTNVVPIHYDLKIESDIAIGDFNFNGETDTEIEVYEPTKEIVLNWKNLTLDETRTHLEKQNGECLSPKEHLYDTQRQMLTFVFDDIIPPAIYTLHLEFSGVLSADLRGFYPSSYVNEDGDETWLAATHFQPISARRAFPCWDEPAFKATFNVSVKHHANYTALSNMPAFEQSVTNESDDKVWTRFEKTPVMSTHILAFVIFDFENISTPDGSTRVWAKKSLIPNVRYFFDVVQKIGDWLEDYTNTSVAVPKMDHVAVPDFSSGATENWGLILYKESDVMYYPEKSTVHKADNIMMLAGHEMSHQWISNLVGPHWWKYMWMSEGFAAYFQYYITSKVFKESRMMDLFPLQVLEQIAFFMDDCPSENLMNRDVSSPTEIPRIYSYVNYRKAPAVLRMLSHFISEEVFRTGLLKYLHENQYKSAVPDDLWRCMQEALDQSSVPHEEFQVKEVMDSWTDQAGYPTIIVNRDYDTGVVQVRQVGTQRYEDRGACNNKWWVPLNFVTQENPDFSSTLPTHWLNSSEETKTIEGLPKDGWILANIQQTGYYRVQYDVENWRRLARYLNSDNYTNIHVLNRVQLINDAFNAMGTNDLPYDVLGMTMNYLSRETDPLPWTTTVHMDYRIDELLDIPESSAILKPYIQNILSNHLKNMGYEDHPEDDRWTKKMRNIIKNLACMVDIPECYGNATVQLVKYLENPDSINIPPTSEEWVFCYGLRRANESMWNSVLDLYLNNTETYYLSYLACSENTHILKNFLNMTLSDDSPFRKESITGLYDKIIIKGHEAGLDVLVDFVGENLNEIISRSNGEYDVLNFLAYRITTKEQLSKMIALFASKGRSPDDMIKQFEMQRFDKVKILENLREIVKAM